jgi:hypothetical protein
MDRDEMMNLLRAFEAEELKYVLIGATAMGFHGVIRATEDIDLILEASPGNLERLRQALRSVYPDDASIDEIRDEDLLGDYPSIRYYPPSGELFLDLMTRLGDAADFKSVDAETKHVQGILVRVATPRALFDLKKDTLRPLDRRDAAALAERFGLKEGG